MTNDETINHIARIAELELEVENLKAVLEAWKKYAMSQNDTMRDITQVAQRAWMEVAFLLSLLDKRDKELEELRKVAGGMSDWIGQNCPHDMTCQKWPGRSERPCTCAVGEALTAYTEWEKGQGK